MKAYMDLEVGDEVVVKDPNWKATREVVTKVARKYLTVAGVEYLRETGRPRSQDRLDYLMMPEEYEYRLQVEKVGALLREMVDIPRRELTKSMEKLGAVEQLLIRAKELLR